MSDANNILQKIKEQLMNYGAIKDCSFSTYEDEQDLVNKGKFPFINLYMNKLNIMEAGIHKLRDYERHLYTILITFGVRHRTKTAAMEGDGKEYGIWDLWEHMQTAIRKDLSFNKTVKATVWKPDLIIDSGTDPSGQFWYGGGQVEFQVYNDVFVKRLNNYQ